LNESLVILFGPLAGIEARRALSRTWVLVVRLLATFLAAVALACVIWIWWITTSTLHDFFSPLGTLQGGLATVEGMFVTCAWLLTPALLAGSFSGEQVRASLALVLATRVSPRELVSGRLAGRLAAVGIILLAAIPTLVFLAGLADLGAREILLLMLLPAAVGFGAGGVACAASAASRRGRDALLIVYLFDLLLLLAPVFGRLLPGAIDDWLEPLNPYGGIGPLIEHLDPRPALAAAALWFVLGAGGVAFAAWRLRPTTLWTASVPRRSRLFGRGRVPAVGDRPMYWKEMHIEGMKTVNRFARLLAGTLVLLFFGTSVVFAAIIAWADWHRYDLGWVQVALTVRRQFEVLMAAAHAMAWLLQWGLGLRAAVTISSERERRTWDALLGSPLEAREIVAAKIYGSVYALRWLILAIFLAWGLGFACEALPGEQFAYLLASTLLIGVYMVALGVYFSLYCSSVTRAMALVIVGWIVGLIVTTMAAGIVVMLIAALAWFMASIGAVDWSPFFQGRTSIPNAMVLVGIGYTVLRLVLYALMAFGIAVYCWRRFDAMAGRTFAPAIQPRRRRRRRPPQKAVELAIPVAEPLPLDEGAEPNSSAAKSRP
jgi:ABC-type transport system involved in multi-copper enzyme maturation permease subunit